MLIGVLVALALAVAVWVGAWLTLHFEHRAEARLAAQQTLEANMWARMLSSRLEAQQRLLVSIAQGMHSSLLDKPEVLDALMRQDGSILSLFEVLHVALPSGAVSHHSASVPEPVLGDEGLRALRRTIGEGKPTVVTLHAVRPQGDEFLRVLMAVPIRHADGHVSGALAATVKYPHLQLLPDLRAHRQAQQYLLLDSNGAVLARSEDAPLEPVMPPWWRELSATAQAETVYRDGMLVTHVALPLPQWQAVIVNRIAGTASWLPRLPLRSWAWLLAGVAVPVGAAGLLLWRWRLLYAQEHAAQRIAEAVPPHELDQALMQLEQTHAMVMHMPSPLLLVRDDAVFMMTLQAVVLLGYCRPEMQALPLSRLLHQCEARKTIQRELRELGSYEGMVQLRKKDGDVLVAKVSAWATDESATSAVWQLGLTWRHRLGIHDVIPSGRDSLTGLLDREAFMGHMQVWAAAAMSASRSEPAQPHEQMPAQGCLLFADLDHLGLMNEATSRDMGNCVLQHVARIMSSLLQPLADVARLGGDEFVVLLPGVSLAHAQSIGQMLCDAVQHWQPFLHGERHWVGISVGVVAVDALRHTPEEALRAADMACYEAKRRGRSQVAVGQIAASPLSSVQAT